MEKELVAIEGLDSAIIGTTFCNETEVLCYSYDKCVRLVMQKGITEVDAESFIAELATTSVVGAPVFVQLDEVQLVYDRQCSSGTIH